MKRGVKISIGIGIVLAVLVIAGTAVFHLARSAGLLSVGLNDQGYEPYDPLLQGNTYDTSKFVWENGHCDGLSQERTQQCKAVMKPYAGVTVKNGQLTQTALPYATSSGQPSIHTQDLRLINFKTEFSMMPGGIDGGTVCWYTYCYTDTRPAKTRASSPTATLELVWDDYNEGHYQLLINNEIVNEGTVPEGTPFYLTKTPASDYGTQHWLAESFTWKNPRTKRLFGCDLQAGEVLAFRTIKGPATITIDDLDGFQRFCPDHPATYLKAGVTSSSNQVYYSLASDEPLTVNNNQAWKIVYVANAVKAGVRLDCASVNTENNQCGDLTGFADLGPSVVYVEDQIDNSDDIGIISQKEVLFNTHYGHTSVLGGLFTATPPRYTCQGSDGYDTSSPVYFNYPAPREECYTFTINDHEWTGGETDVKVNDFFTVNVESAHANLCYCNGNQGGLKRPDKWNVEYHATLRQPLITSITINTEDTINREDDANALVTLTNEYDRTLNATIITSTRSTITGETRSTSTTATLDPGKNTITIPLQTSVLGEQTLTARVYLRTDSDSLHISEDASTTYTITSTTSTSTSTTPDAATTSTGFLEAIINAIKSLFAKLFGGNA